MSTIASAIAVRRKRWLLTGFRASWNLVREDLERLPGLSEEDRHFLELIVWKSLQALSHGVVISAVVEVTVLRLRRNEAVMKLRCLLLIHRRIAPEKF